MGHRIKKRVTITLDSELLDLVDKAVKENEGDRSSLISMVLELVFKPEKFAIQQGANPTLEVVKLIVIESLAKVLTPFMEAMKQAQQETEAKP
jgi:hypothetical protein